LVKKPKLYIKALIRELFNERIAFYAGSMSWSTLFFIIPFMVILLVIFTHLPLFNSAYTQLHELISKNLVSTDSKTIMRHIDTFVANADKLGYIGVIYVTIATVLFFKDYDYIVNDIFETPRRSTTEAIWTYLFLLLFLPLMLGGLFWLHTATIHLLENIKLIELFYQYLFSYLVVWFLFYIAYQFSPSVSISPKVAILSSFITSLIWFIAKSLFIFYIIYNKTYSSIYGTLSTLLFFFLWIYLSWAIFLYGLRLCYIINKKLIK